MSDRLDEIAERAFCGFCGSPATCCGTYGLMSGVACDECCGHVDGKCRPLVKAKPADPINPAHYKRGKFECIDAIRAALTAAEFRGFCKGNAMKYLWREQSKGGNTDLAKAEWYIRRWLGEDDGKAANQTEGRDDT